MTGCALFRSSSRHRTADVPYARLASVDLRQCETVYYQRSVKQSNDGLRYSSAVSVKSAELA